MRFTFHPCASSLVIPRAIAIFKPGSLSPLIPPQAGEFATQGLVSQAVGNANGGGVASTFGFGQGSLIGMKSVISVQSKRLAEDVNHVYDRQILYTTKIQSQRSRIEDLTFRIIKAEKELVSFAFTCGAGAVSTAL